MLQGFLWTSIGNHETSPLVYCIKQNKLQEQQKTQGKGEHKEMSNNRKTG